MTDVALARKGLAIYFSVVVVGTAILQWRIITGGGTVRDQGGLILLLMWVPTVASVVARVALKEGVGDVSFRLGGRAGAKALLFGWLFPVAVGLVAYGIAWMSGIAGFEPPPVEGVAVQAPWARFAVRLLIALSAGQIMSAVSAAGEEFGWRGYMLTRLIRARVPRPLVTSALIWGLWHTPLILSGQYATGPNHLLSAGMFVLSIVGAGVLIGWLRLYSGSVWPAVLAHGSWNIVIQWVFDQSTTGAEPGGAAAFWIGESGVLVIAVLLLSAALVTRFARVSTRAVPETA